MRSPKTGQRLKADLDSLLLIHVTSTQNESFFCLLVDKEYREITSSPCLSQSSVHVFTPETTFVHLSDSGTVRKYLFNLRWCDMVLGLDLVYHSVQPQKLCDLHASGSALLTCFT